ncbi:MAG: biosynthetic-type acetolactate synthase large subunit [Candidatus Bathyarchaeota archaeon]|nr:biosynthetic-type acetolactate synthase large subunit [Candidatus Bathyarchaeota archaeon]
MSGSQALIKALEKEKVKVIFGLPGGQIMPVYDALLGSKMRHVLARHEQSAAHMADGYARASNNVGVCMATSGPGATNLVTGIATAYLDSSPVVAITGQVPTPQIGLDAFQEADIIGVSTPITKYNFQPRSAKDVPGAVRTAFFIASSGRPGPVLIDLPRDVQIESDEIEFTGKSNARGYIPSVDPDLYKIKKAAEMILDSKRPFILAGGGVRISNAFKQLQELAELLLAPVGTSLMGKGCFPENHPLSLGLVGMHGAKEANKIVMESDVLLAIGIRFSDRTTGKLDGFCPDTKVIHIDIDATEIGKNRCVDLAIISSADKALSLLNKALKETSVKKKTSWSKRIKEVRETVNSNKQSPKELSPPRILRELRKVLPLDSIVTTEVGQNQMWAALNFKAIKPRTFISSGGFGCMGYGFPAAIGAKVAKPDVPVVDIAGDGSFRMTENSLSTSVDEDIPVIVVILNNQMLGMVAQWQRLFFGHRYSAVELHKIPDFVKLTKSYGAEGIRVNSLKEFTSAVKKAMNTPVTTVIDVPIDPEEDVLPMVPAGQSLDKIIE